MMAAGDRLLDVSCDGHKKGYGDSVGLGGHPVFSFAWMIFASRASARISLGLTFLASKQFTRKK